MSSHHLPLPTRPPFCFSSLSEPVVAPSIHSPKRQPSSHSLLLSLLVLYFSSVLTSCWFLSLKYFLSLFSSLHPWGHPPLQPLVCYYLSHPSPELQMKFLKLYRLFLTQCLCSCCSHFLECPSPFIWLTSPSSLKQKLGISFTLCPTRINRAPVWRHLGQILDSHRRAPCSPRASGCLLGWRCSCSIRECSRGSIRREGSSAAS